MSEQLLVAMSGEMNRIADTLELVEDRLSAIERGSVNAGRVLQLEEALRKIHDIATNDSWRDAAFYRDRHDIAQLASEALDGAVPPLSEERIFGKEMQP